MHQLMWSQDAKSCRLVDPSRPTYSYTFTRWGDTCVMPSSPESLWTVWRLGVSVNSWLQIRLGYWDELSLLPSSWCRYCHTSMFSQVIPARLLLALINHAALRNHDIVYVTHCIVNRCLPSTTGRLGVMYFHLHIHIAILNYNAKLETAYFTSKPILLTKNIDKKSQK